MTKALEPRGSVMVAEGFEAHYTVDDLLGWALAILHRRQWLSHPRRFSASVKIYR